MKTGKLILVSGVLLFAGCATELGIASTDVPQAVLDAFTQKYPNAQVEEWEVEKDKDQPLVFEASFKADGKEKEAKFKPDGTFVNEE